MKTLQWTVEKLPPEPRLDKVIPLLDPSISRSLARKLVEAGSVFVNRSRCHQNAKNIRIGDIVRINLMEQTREELRPLDQDRIIFEDQDIIVVNKPPFLPTHETLDSSRFHLVLATQMLLENREKKKKSEIYLGIHHRLDRDTSGVIVFSKRKEANAALAQAFQERKAQKTYLALCQGTHDSPFLIQSFLGTSPKNKRIVCSVKKGGKFAETEVSILESRKDGKKVFSLVEAKPKTGRTHQIRVHLSENGLPILGDSVYGVTIPEAKRVMLHAWKLEILGHSFQAPVPKDFNFLKFSKYLE